MVSSASSLFRKHTYSLNVIYIRHTLFIVERLMQSATSSIYFISPFRSFLKMHILLRGL